MADSRRTLPSSFADWSRLDSLLNDSLDDFCAGISESPHTEQQEMRALAVCWIATFLPEACAPAFRAELERVVLLLRGRADHRYDIWWQIPPLEAALFALKGDRQWLGFLIPNLNHHSRVLRTPVIEALGYIADRLDFEEPEFQERVLSNLASRQALADEALLALLGSRGLARDKKAWLEVHSRGDAATSFSECRVVADLQRDGWATNSWFPVKLHEPLLYIAAELARPHLKRGQIALALDHIEAAEPPGHTGSAAPGELFVPADLWSLMSERLKVHPLHSTLFKLPHDLQRVS